MTPRRLVIKLAPTCAGDAAHAAQFQFIRTDLPTWEFCL